MFKLYFLTYVADVVASVTLNYQLIQNSIEFENLIFLFKNWDGAELKTRPSNLPDINLNQSKLTRDTTYLVRVNPHKSSSNSRK
jgi:hypothetical protein